MNDIILRQRDVEERLGVGRTTLWQWRKDGIFPAPMRLGPSLIGWRESEITAWLDSRELAT